MLYKLFDLYYDIEFINEQTKEFLSDYLTDENRPPCESIKITSEEIFDELKKDTTHNEAYHEFICIFRHLCASVMKHNGLFIHSAVISMDGCGYMFSGRSGAGKSTHIGEWVKYFGAERVKIINGDKPVIRFFDDGIYAYGNPWHGIEGWSLNSKVKLKSVCFIKKAKENRIRRMKAPEILYELINQTVIPKNSGDKLTYFGLLDKFISGLDFYELECDISAEAVKTAYNAMKGE